MQDQQVEGLGIQEKNPSFPARAAAMENPRAPGWQKHKHRERLKILKANELLREAVRWNDSQQEK